MEFSYSHFLNIIDTLHPLVYVGLLLILSYISGRIANYLKAPRVTGYLIMGIIAGPSFLGLFRDKLVKEDLTLITDIALAIIAFFIGGSLSLKKLRKIGKQILYITFAEAFGTFLVTTSVLALSFCLVYDLDIKSPFFLGTYLPVALIIGALCAATAPAATMAIVHEYKSKGPLTSILIGVVALDDSAAIIFFAFAVTLAKSFASHAAINWENFLLIPFFSIFVSLLIGGISGALLWKLSDFISRKGALFSIIIGSIFVTAGAASSLGVSPLLSSMMFGFMVVNLVQCHENLFNVVENIEEPIFGMFFMLAGAHMNFGVMRTAGWLALIITVGRFAGKLIGSRLGASASHASASVKKYLGFALLPSAGVAVGLVLEAREILGPSSYVSEVMVNAVLGSIIINELLTPFFVRSVLVKAGEAMRESDQGADKGVIE